VAALERDNAARQRSTAVNEAELAKREREEADRQRTVAEHRFNELRQLALNLLDLDKEIVPLNGATKARQSLVNTALTYLEKLRSESEAQDLGFRLELAEAYRKVADVQAGPGHPNLGQIKEALANLETAEKLLLTGEKNEGRTLTKLVENLDLQARMEGNAHDWPSARVRAGRGIQYLKDLKAMALRMSERERLAVLAAESSLEYVAQAIAVNLEHTKEGIAHGSRSAAARAEIYRITGRPEDEATYATTMMGLANTLRTDASVEASLEHAVAGRRIFDKQYEAAKGSTATGRKLLWACYIEGRILGSMTTVSLGRFDEAERSFERSLTIGRTVADADREDLNTRDILGYAAYELGMLRLERDPAAALALFDEGYRRRSEAPSSHPVNELKIDVLAASIRALARLRRHDEARARLEQLFTILRENKNYPGEIRPGNFLANSLVAKAEAVAAAGELDESVQIWRELLAAYDKSDRGTDDPHWALFHAAAYRGFAKVLARAGKTDEARIWREKDIALWTGWDRKLPRNPFVMHQLSAARM
jgi:tetratricopeptide (TPR) repeat protein